VKVLGVILIVVGVVSLGFGAVSFTRKEKVIDAGPIEVTADKKETVPLSPILGAASLVGGIAVLIMANRK
jgi:uncharacterized membrane protein YidH (DUF202 family)